MAIPDFQRIMLPLLKFCADGQEHTNREAIDSMAKEFGLTEDEQKQLLPSGQFGNFTGNTVSIALYD